MQSLGDLGVAAQQVLLSPVGQQARLTASAGKAGDGFGEAIAIDGDTIVVGAGGAAYIFTEAGSRWVQVAELSASDGAAGGGFGASVSISGDTVAVGASAAAVGASAAAVGASAKQGAAYVFTEPSTGWVNMTQTATLTASDGAPGDEFGDSISVSGNTIVVGAESAIVGNNTGAAYVFTEPATGWTNMTQSAKLTDSAGTANGFFGTSVSISGDTVVAIGSGTAHVFTKSASAWKQSACLSASGQQVGEQFGASLAVSGNAVVIGSSQTDVMYWGSGAAYVFIEPGSGWTDMTQTARLTPSDGDPFGGFGSSVAVSGDTVVVGAKSTDVAVGNTTANNYASAGRLYFFDKPSSGWADATETFRLAASDHAYIGGFGGAVAVSGNVIAAGAAESTVGSNSGQGVAYLFGSPGEQPAYRLYNPATQDHLFTTDLNECQTLTGRGWIYEEPACNWYSAPATVDGVTDEPMYRLYDPSIRQHLWTTDLNEYTTLATRGWAQEGIAGYVFPTAVAASEPMYRLTAPQVHLWTTNLVEYNGLAADGWTQEGIIGYVL